MKNRNFILASLIFITIMFVGCTKQYSKTENTLIDTANSLISKEFNISIDKSKYEYNIGKEIKKDHFVDLKKDEIPKIVHISGLKSGKPKKGEVISYYISFNTKTNEIFLKKCEIY